MQGKQLRLDLFCIDCVYVCVSARERVYVAYFACMNLFVRFIHSENDDSSGKYLNSIEKNNKIKTLSRRIAYICIYDMQHYDTHCTQHIYTYCKVYSNGLHGIPLTDIG